MFKSYHVSLKSISGLISTGLLVLLLLSACTYSPIYHLHFSTNGGTGGYISGDQDSYHYPNNVVTITAGGDFIEKTGFAFHGWNTKRNGSGTHYDTGDTFIMPAKDVTIWVEWGYGITDELGGGMNNTENPSSYLDEEVVFADPTRTGYTFLGWFSDSSFTTPIESIDEGLTENITVYAQWQVNTYGVSFDSNGGSAPSPSSKNVTFDESYGSLPEVSWSGCVFGGWYTGEKGTGDLITENTQVSIAANHTLYARWDLTVSFDSQGGYAPSPARKTIHFGQTYGALAAAMYPGYAFMGWWTEPEGKGTLILADDVVSIRVDHILYASWQPENYSISFDAQEGTLSGSDSIVVTYGSAYGTLPTPELDYYDFAGWWTEELGSGTQITSTSTVAITSDTTLYAKWCYHTFTGPAGGLVFYDKGAYSDGWRYLEAAPFGWYDTDNDGSLGEDTDPRFQWGACNELCSVVPSAQSLDIGSGATNTTNIVDYHNQLWHYFPDWGDYYTYPTAYYSYNNGTVAAKVCLEYSLENDGKVFDDWFLPSLGELELMYRNIALQDNRGFSMDTYYWSSYWSSSEDSGQGVHVIDFSNGSYQGAGGKHQNNYVRPIRMY
ncbi:MAG: InlB B-repeat-containing protein [Sphaerochaetaceae bacterium]